MACSPAQLKSNRTNAKHSTGPKTGRGKARSRANAVKHNLTGEGHCLPIEDAAELQTRFDAMADALKPQDEPERVMARRAALLSLRLDRCAMAEAAALSKAVRDAVSDHDERLMAEVRAIADTFPLDPAGAVRKLKRTAQGVDFLVEHWQGLRDALDHFGGLDDVEATRAEQLQGRRHDASGLSRIKKMIDASAGLFVGDDGHLGFDIENLPEHRAAARVELDGLLGREIDRLEAHRLTLRHADAERDRIEAPLRAVIDLSPRGQLTRRYENAAAREIHKIFDCFDVFSPVPEVENLAVTTEEGVVSVELASFGECPESELTTAVVETVSVSPNPPSGCPIEPVGPFSSVSRAMDAAPTG